MPRLSLRMMLAVVVLAACQASQPGGGTDQGTPVSGGSVLGGSVSGGSISGAAISVTSLDDPPTTEPTAAGPGETATITATAAPLRPKPRPAGVAAKPAVAAVAEPVAAEVVPEVLKPKEQIACEKQGGVWAVAGKTAARACVRQTRDGGKQCRKASDCEGLCLARSGTCAPIAPLFGCNEIFQDDGRRVTLCLD